MHNKVSAGHSSSIPGDMRAQYISSHVCIVSLTSPIILGSSFSLCYETRDYDIVHVRSSLRSDVQCLKLPLLFGRNESSENRRILQRSELSTLNGHHLYTKNIFEQIAHLHNSRKSHFVFRTIRLPHEMHVLFKTPLKLHQSVPGITRYKSHNDRTRQRLTFRRSLDRCKCTPSR